VRAGDWVPSIAVTGMAFYTGSRFPAWQRNIFVGGLREGETPRTGQLQRLVFNERWEELRREPHQRIRDVREARTGCSTCSRPRTPARCCASNPIGDSSRPVPASRSRRHQAADGFQRLDAIGRGFDDDEHRHRE
jgi:hypothetical protein